MERNECIALYTINKQAKQLRDDICKGKRMLKERLFEPYSFDEKEEFPKMFGIDLSFDLEDCIDINKQESVNNNFLKERLFKMDKILRKLMLDDIEIEDSAIECIEKIEEYSSWSQLLNDESAIDKVKDILSEKEYAALDYYIDECKQEKKDIEFAIKHNDELHEFLHNGFKKYYNLKNYLYDLKSLTIKNSKEKPISFCKMKGCYNILALYKIGEFTFHSIYDDDSVNVSDCEELEMISSFNALPTDEKLELNECIKILCDFNNLSSEIYDTVINADEYIEDLFGEIFPKPEGEYHGDFYCNIEEYDDYEYDDFDFFDTF